SAFYQRGGVIGGGVRFGSGTANGALTFTGNYVANGAQNLDINNWSPVTVTNNTFAGTPTSYNSDPFLVNFQNPRAVSWDTNTYYTTSTKGPFAFNRTVGPDGGGW